MLLSLQPSRADADRERPQNCVVILLCLPLDVYFWQFVWSKHTKVFPLFTIFLLLCTYLSYVMTYFSWEYSLVDVFFLCNTLDIGDVNNIKMVWRPGEGRGKPLDTGRWGLVVVENLEEDYVQQWTSFLKVDDDWRY